MERIIEEHKKYCRQCNTPDNLSVYTKRKRLTDGVMVYYYVCRPCNAEKRRKWYHNGNQAAAQKHNTNYRHKKANA